MKWLTEIHRKKFVADGYTVVRGVVPTELIAPAVEEIVAFIAADLDRPETWYGGNAVNDGIVPLHHGQAIWNIRQCRPIYGAFSEFWGHGRLMVDINRSCFRPPIHEGHPTVSRGEIHWDADPRVDRPASLQAIVLLTDVGADAGGFHRSCCRRSSCPRKDRSATDATAKRSGCTRLRTVFHGVWRTS